MHNRDVAYNCTQCRRAYTWRAEQADSSERRLAEWLEGKPVYAATGCEHCLDGYSGRSGLFELMVPSPAIMGGLRGSELHAEALYAQAVAAGMVPLGADGADKVLGGVTSAAEVAGALAG